MNGLRSLLGKSRSKAKACRAAAFKDSEPRPLGRVEDPSAEEAASEFRSDQRGLAPAALTLRGGGSTLNRVQQSRRSEPAGPRPHGRDAGASQRADFSVSRSTLRPYRSSCITSCRAVSGGQMRESGRVASGSSTMLSNSRKLSFSVLA